MEPRLGRLSVRRQVRQNGQRSRTLPEAQLAFSEFAAILLYLSGNTSEFRFLANLPRFPSWRSSIVVFLMSDSARNLDRSPRPDSAQSPAASRPTELVCLAAVIAVYLGLSFSSAGQMSVTVDEFGHLPSGLYTPISGDPRYAALNPPLANV